MKSNEENYIILDIETGADVEAAKRADEVEPNKKRLMPEPIPKLKEWKANILITETAKLNKKYSKQDTIDKHLENDVYSRDFKSEYIEIKKKHDSLIHDFAKKPPFSFIKLVRVISVVNGEKDIKVWHNEHNSYNIEKDIIEELSSILYNSITGKKGLNTQELWTVNGKHFDIPVITERAGITRAKVNFIWLENLMKNGDRYGHYDIVEHRKYNNTRMPLSLSRNLAIRYGVKFAKNKIDFASCSMDELDFYNLDEMLKMEYWCREHHGMSVIPIEDFIDSLPKPTFKMKESSNKDLPEL